MKPENKFRKDALNKVAGGVNETTPTEEQDPLKLSTEEQKNVAPEDLPKVAGGTGETMPIEEKDPLKLGDTTTKKDVDNQPSTPGEVVAPSDLINVAGGGKNPIDRVKEQIRLEKSDPDSLPFFKPRTPKLPPRTKSPLGGAGKKIK